MLRAAVLRDKKGAAGEFLNDFLDDAADVVGAGREAGEDDEVEEGGAHLLFGGKGFPDFEKLRLDVIWIDDLLNGHRIRQVLPSFSIIALAAAGPQLPEA